MKILLIVVIITISIFYFFFFEHSYYKGKVSDHFDGKYFFNPSEKNISDKGSTKRNFFSYYLSKIDYQKKHGTTQWQEQRIDVDTVKPLASVNDDTIHTTFVGHSTFLIQFQNYNILTDPIWSDRASPFSFIGPKRAVSPAINFADLPKIDLVLISHSHYDHMDLETIKKLQNHSQPNFITGLGNCYFLNKLRKLNLKCYELDWQDKYTHSPELTIHFLPAKHWSKRMMFGRNASLWGSFVLESKLGNIYFAGDTGFDDHFLKASQQFKKFKLAFIPIGAYKPKDFMLKYHLDPIQAVQAHKDLFSKTSIAMHYQTFKLSSENYQDPLIDLSLELQKNNISDQFIALGFGKKLITK